MRLIPAILGMLMLCTLASAANPSVSFSQAVYPCGGTIQFDYQNANNSELYLFSLDAYGEPIWSDYGLYGSNTVYPGLNLSVGSYIIEMRNVNGTALDFDTMTVESCGGTGGDGGGTDDGTGGGGGTGGTGGDGGGTDPFSGGSGDYDGTNPGDEYKIWLDLNKDGITSYAERIAAFRFWGFTCLFVVMVMAVVKFGFKKRLW